jgi:CRISPR-associated protein Csb2
VPQFLEAEIRRELSYRDRAVEPTLITIREQHTREWPLFVRHRWRGGTRADARPGYGLELEFREPVVQGPLALGWLSHFGLGLFSAI